MGYFDKLDLDPLLFKPLDAGKPSSLWDRAKRGVGSTTNAAQIAVAGPEEVAGLVADEARNQLAPSVAAQAMQADIKPYQDAYIESSGLGAVGAAATLAAKRLAQLITNPREAAGMIAESLPNSAPGMAGMVAGGMAGAATPIPGGAIAGSLVGGTAGGYLIEQGAAMRDQIMKEAQARGVDPKDAAALAPIIAEKYDEFLQASRLKGAGTAVTDAVLTRLTMGLGGIGERAIVKGADASAAAIKAGAKTAAEGAVDLTALTAKEAGRNTLMAKARRGAGMTVAEMGGEATSEAVGQQLAYGKVDPLDVIDEGLLAVGQGAAMAGTRGLYAKAVGATETNAADAALARLGSQVQARQAQADKGLADLKTATNPDALVDAALRATDIPLLPVGEATEVQLPVGDGLQDAVRDLTAPRIPVGEVIPNIPVGDVIEPAEEIPVGDAIPLPDVIEAGGDLPLPEGMAPRTPKPAPAAPTKPMTDADIVRAVVDGFRKTNTPQARAFVQDFDAGRIKPADVLALVGKPPTTENRVEDATARLAAAAAQAPKGEPSLLLTADGQPYGTRSGAYVRAKREGLDTGAIVTVPGGWAVRKESTGVQSDVPVPAPVAVRAPDGGGDQPSGSLGAVGRVADAGGAGSVQPGVPEVAASGDAAQPAVPGRSGAADAALSSDIARGQATRLRTDAQAVLDDSASADWEKARARADIKKAAEIDALAETIAATPPPAQAQEGEFIRKPTNAESKGTTPRQRAMRDLFEQHRRSVVFKPYGSKGAGFYFAAPATALATSAPAAPASESARTKYLAAVADLGASINDFRALTLARAQLESDGKPAGDADILRFMRNAGDVERADRLEARRKDKEAAPASDQQVPATAAKPKVYKTRKGAEAAKAGNTQRLRAVKGGYILRAATDKELAAADRNGRRLASGGGIDVERDSLLTAIAKLGGVRMNEKADTIGEGNKNVGGKMLFTQAGKSIDDLGNHALQEFGYIPAGERRDPTRWLRSAISAEFMGTDSFYSDQGTEWMQEQVRSGENMSDAELDEMREADRADAAESADDGSDWANSEDALADWTVDDLDGAGYTGAAPEVQALTEQLIAEAEALGIDTEAIREDVAKATERETADVYHAAVQDAIRAAIRQARADAQGRDAGAARPSRPDRGEPAGEAGQDEGLTLSAPTRAQVLAQQDALEQERAARDAPSDKPKSKLTGDQVDIFNPQGSVFDAPAEPDPAPTADPFASDYAALVGKTIEQTVTTDDGKTAKLRMDAARALRDFDQREKNLADLKACLGRAG